VSPPRTVAIIGLGLMGGSLARDLAALGVRVLAHDVDPAGPRLAMSGRVVAGVLDDSLAGVREADVVVLAAPVDRCGGILETIAPHVSQDAVVTDVGSTKATLGAVAERAGLGDRFVGAHPLAGDHRSGWDAAREGLFRGATVFLCPSPRAAAPAVARVEGMWRSVGAECALMDAGAHDTLMAWVSHLPQVAASAVAAALADAGYVPAQLGRGGRDVTRLAASSPGLWSAICRDNAVAISAAVHALGTQLTAFETALRSGDDEALRRFFGAGHDWLA
jgi:prephenate dehydrogenase